MLHEVLVYAKPQELKNEVTKVLCYLAYDLRCPMSRWMNVGIA